MKSFIGAVLFICVAFSANAQLLWKVSGNGLNQPSYIIGRLLLKNTKSPSLRFRLATLLLLFFSSSVTIL